MPLIGNLHLGAMRCLVIAGLLGVALCMRGAPSASAAAPEGAVFTPDGQYLLIGNYLDQDISILKVNGTEITNTGKRFKLPGHPASMRISKQ